MPKPFTAKMVEKIAPDPKGRREIPDGLLPGLYLVVQPSGAKSWAIRYRANGRPRKFTLGSFPKIELGEARDLAREHMRAISKGADPAAEKRAAKAAQAAPDLPTTMGDLCDLYVKRHLKKNVRRWQAAEREIERHIRPRLGDKPLAELKRAHIRQLLAEIVEVYPVQANRTLSRIRAIMNWALGEDLIEADPTAGIKRPTKETPADRILSDDELRAVWTATDRLGHPAQPFMRILMLTGQRRDDVRLMHWDEINLPERTWIIPANRYKARRPHLVPLTEQAAAILEVMPFREAGGYVFSTDGGGRPYSNVQKPKAAIDKASKVTGWTLHDVRRTVRTGLSRLGVRPDIAERVIGHAVGGRLGQTYDVYEYVDEKRRALEAWAAHLARVVEGREAAADGNVVRLAAAQ
jgi:integrase